MRFRLFTASLLLCAVGPGRRARHGVHSRAANIARGRTHKLPDDNLKWYPTLMKDDRPVRRIHVDPFYLDEHEVTNEQYAAFVKATRHRAPYNWPGGQDAGRQGGAAGGRRELG